MNKLGITELSTSLANKRNLDTGIANTFIENFFEILSESLRKEKVVKIKGLGTFKIITVSARKSVDVNTGEAIEITSRDKISFVPDATLRDLINRPFAQFETVVVNDGADFSAIDKAIDTPLTSVTGNRGEIPDPESQTSDHISVLDDSEKETPMVLSHFVEEAHKDFLESCKKEDVSPETIVHEMTKTNSVEEPEKRIIHETVENSSMQNDVLQKQIISLSEANELLQSQLKHARRIVHLVAIGIFMCLLFIIIGTFYVFTKFSTITPPSKQIVAKQIHFSTNKKTINNLEKNVTENKSKDTLSSSETSSSLATTQFNPTQYDNDVRVRTGAYRIIGVKTSVKVRAGQTLSSISKYYLGPGMECYVEAINGISEVKEGQIIKIPELRNKLKHK